MKPSDSKFGINGSHPGTDFGGSRTKIILYHVWYNLKKQLFQVLFKVLIKKTIDKPKVGIRSIPKLMNNATWTENPTTSRNLIGFFSDQDSGCPFQHVHELIQIFVQMR
jgi:hypothetical protein